MKPPTPTTTGNWAANALSAVMRGRATRASGYIIRPPICRTKESRYATKGEYQAFENETRRRPMLWAGGGAYKD